MSRDLNSILADLAATSDQISKHLHRLTEPSAQKLAPAIDALPLLVAEIVQHASRHLSATVGEILLSKPDGTVVLGLGAASHPFEYRLYNDQIDGRPAGSGRKEWHVQAAISRDLRQRGIVLPSKFADLLLVAPEGMVIEACGGQGPNDWWQASRDRGFRWWNASGQWSLWKEYESIPFGTSIGNAVARAIFDVERNADASPLTRGPIEVAP